MHRGFVLAGRLTAKVYAASAAVIWLPSARDHGTTPPHAAAVKLMTDRGVRAESSSAVLSRQALPEAPGD